MHIMRLGKIDSQLEEVNIAVIQSVTSGEFVPQCNSSGEEALSGTYSSLMVYEENKELLTQCRWHGV